MGTGVWSKPVGTRLARSGPPPLRSARSASPPSPVPRLRRGNEGPGYRNKAMSGAIFRSGHAALCQIPEYTPSAARATFLRGLDYMHRISAPGYQLLVTVPRVTQSGVGFRGSTQPTGDTIFMLGHSIGHDITTVRDRCPVLSVVRKGF